MKTDSPSSESPPITAPHECLNRWADAALRIGHLNTLTLRAIQEGSLERAQKLAERARVATFGMFNEFLVSGAENPASEPEYPYVYWHRALACEALGQNEEARKQFELFAQGLIAAAKVPAPHLIASVREKFLLYGLSELYVF